MAGDPYNTNLAAEFIVLATLHRLGRDAFLTLGNKKGVDIVIVTPSRTAVSLEVKGVAGKYDWPADNVHIFDKRHQLYALVCFEGKIKEPDVMPSIWIVPSSRLQPFVRQYKGRVVISRAAVLKDGKEFQRAWQLIEDSSAE
jgi:hypothetical protein